VIKRKNMKIRLTLLFAFILVGNLLAQNNLSIMTFNIRYDNPGDGENRWQNRKSHVADVLRFFEAELLLSRLKSIAGNHPVIVCGDFNATPDDEPIRLLNAPGALTETQSISETPHFGPEGTFTGFGPSETRDKPIDFIFLKNAAFRVLKHATIAAAWGGRYASDHHAVWALLAD